MIMLDTMNNEYYVIIGLTFKGACFREECRTIEEVCDVRDTIEATVSYFGGGSVTVYKVDGYNVTIYDFEKI